MLVLSSASLARHGAQQLSTCQLLKDAPPLLADKRAGTARASVAWCCCVPCCTNLCFNLSVIVDMKLYAAALISALISVGNLAPVKKCTAEKRIAAAQCVPYAYNQPDLGASAAGFAACPFADDLQTYL